MSLLCAVRIPKTKQFMMNTMHPFRVLEASKWKVLASSLWEWKGEVLRKRNTALHYWLRHPHPESAGLDSLPESHHCMGWDAASNNSNSCPLLFKTVCVAETNTWVCYQCHMCTSRKLDWKGGWHLISHRHPNIGLGCLKESSQNPVLCLRRESWFVETLTQHVLIEENWN